MTPNVDRAGRLQLHYAALEGRVPDVAAYLQQHRDDVNLADKAGFTPLHFAAQGQHADVAVLPPPGHFSSTRGVGAAA
ncbi:MAG: ankyrin repeat domain-containing protein [Acidimicrobiaceae bacterium]|nr:ankyrin repeat domain-containing protein [Acidimicrobiaceae bacterium]